VVFLKRKDEIVLLSFRTKLTIESPQIEALGERLEQKYAAVAVSNIARSAAWL
jgi:hypothetical protein